MSAIIEKLNLTEEEQKEYDRHNPNSEAIARGCGVNELGYRISRPLRPLHAAIENPGSMDRTGKFHDRLESLDMVRFLLAHGADPRLRAGQAGIPWYRWLTPMDEALYQARHCREAGSSDYRFWEEAREMMIEAAKKLTAKEEAERGLFGWMFAYLYNAMTGSDRGIPNDVSVGAQMPTYAFLGWAEILATVPGTELAYLRAPSPDALVSWCVGDDGAVDDGDRDDSDDIIEIRMAPVA
ncbi:hypothetical protein DL771_006642 [Monosporascus sp. 5C6A]|nr:hypothetical protein DL771_006642 [Monosporascus sp. 5C6A]